MAETFRPVREALGEHVVAWNRLAGHIMGFAFDGYDGDDAGLRRFKRSQQFRALYNTVDDATRALDVAVRDKRLDVFCETEAAYMTWIHELQDKLAKSHAREYAQDNRIVEDGLAHRKEVKKLRAIIRIREDMIDSLEAECRDIKAHSVSHRVRSISHRVRQAAWKVRNAWIAALNEWNR